MICKTCGEDKDKTEFYHYRKVCKKCVNKLHYEKHKEVYKEKREAYLLEHAEEIATKKKAKEEAKRTDRICPKCGKMRNWEDYFYCQGQWHSKCKFCYYKNHNDATREYRKDYYAKNKDRILKYQEERIEQGRASCRKYYHKNKEVLREKARKRYHENKERDNNGN